MSHRVKKRKHHLELLFVFFCFFSVFFSFGGMKSLSMLVANIGALLFLITFINLNPYAQNPKVFSLPRWSLGMLIVWFYALIQTLPIYPRLNDPILVQLQQEVWPSISLTPIQTLFQSGLFLLWISIALSSSLIERRKRWGIFILITLGSSNALIGWLHYFFNAEKIFGFYEISSHRALTGYFGIFVNQNTGAALMLMSSILLIGLVFSYQKYALIWLALFALNLSGMIGSDSRAALLSLGIFSLLLSITRLKEHRFLALLFGLSLALGTWLIVMFVKAVGFQEEIKFKIVQDAVGYLKTYWLLGSGKGSFSQIFSQFQHFYIPNLWVSHAENVILEIFCEMGLIGLIFGVIWFVYHLLYWGYHYLKSAHITAIALYLSIWAVCYQQCFDLGLSGMGLSIPVAMAFGLLWSYVPQQKSIILPRKVLTLILSVIVIGYLSSISLRKYVDDVPLDQLIHAKNHTDRKKIVQTYIPYRSHDAIFVGTYANVLLSDQYQSIQEKRDALMYDWADLRPWIKKAKFLAPASDLPYYLDGKMLLFEGLDDLASYSFYQAIKINPLKAKAFFNEINHSKMDPWQAIPQSQYFAYLCDLDEKKKWDQAERAVIGHLSQLNIDAQRLSVKICALRSNLKCLDTLQGLLLAQKDQHYILAVKSALNGDIQMAHSYLRSSAIDDQEIKGQLKLTQILFQRFKQNQGTIQK